MYQQFGVYLEECWRGRQSSPRIIKRIDNTTNNNNNTLARTRRELIDLCGIDSKFLPTRHEEIRDILEHDVHSVTTYVIKHLPGWNNSNSSNTVHVCVLDARAGSSRVVAVDHDAFQKKLLVRVAALIECFSKKKLLMENTKINKSSSQRAATEPPLRILFLPLSHKKSFPGSPSEDITPAHINSGFHVPHTIAVLRHEDHQKVILHEVLHDLFMVPFSSVHVRRLKGFLNIAPKVSLIPNEAVVETMAVVTQVLFLSMEQRGGGGGRQHEIMLEEERRRCEAVRDGLLSMYQWPRRPWTATANVFSYIFIRSQLMTDLDVFIPLLMQAYLTGSWDQLQTFVIEKAQSLKTLKTLKSIKTPSLPLQFNSATVYGSH
jgi:hypothetical protein